MMRYPSTTTKLVVLLGHPLGHSLSPLIHNAMFDHLGLDYCYLPVEVTRENLAVVFNGLRRMNLVGCNVTIPHKVAILEFLDELDPQAALLGAVNTICFRDGRAIGHNTDGQGFLRSLEEAGMAGVAGKNIFVLGAGGAARAIAMSLAAGGAGSIYLCNRNPDKALALAEEINEKIRPCAETVAAELSAQGPVLKRCRLLVNTTSVGMHPHHDQLPIAAEALSAHLTVADIVYNPHTTKLLAAARAKGCPIVHGLGMLIHQGALGFSLWTGREPPIDRMLATALSHLAGLSATTG
jgi:shikimate dehydrogenase